MDKLFSVTSAVKKLIKMPDFTKDQTIMKSKLYHEKQFESFEIIYQVEDITFPLSTHNATIVDAKGIRVKLAGTNWSGAHMMRHCVDGLECRPLKDIALDIKNVFKMNCIRLTYSLQMFYDDNVIHSQFITANPELKGKTSMEIFDITVQTLTDVGLMVILNNHTSKSQWCCSNDDGDGLWWSREYPQYMFFECAQAFAKRYKENPRVIGMDLRNELRRAHGVQATWGTCDLKSDWMRAAKICSEKVLAICPHWLIFVSGLSYQIDLTPFAQYPLQLSIPNKLIYTGHFYSWSWPIPSWSFYSYEKFEKNFFNTQTFVRAMGVPFFLGEFGNNKKDIPWQYLIRYLKQNDIDWTYWCCDGFKGIQKDDQTFGLFTNDFSRVRHQQLRQDLLTIATKRKQQRTI